MTITDIATNESSLHPYVLTSIVAPTGTTGLTGARRMGAIEPESLDGRITANA
jgi:hypothetical protein